MKRNTKITIAALCTMFVMAIAVSALAFLNASRDDQSATMTDANEIIFAEGSLADTYTNIDNIIANSKASNTDADRKYHIVEIGSSAAASGLQEYVKDGRFEELVINSYSTQYENANAAVKVLKTMAPDCITYDFFQASAVTAGNEAALKAISNADLIYVSNDADNSFTKKNDLTIDVYDFLRAYAVGSNKPLIIDAPKATSGSTSGGGSSAVTKTVANLVDEYFDPMGLYRYTFGWNKSTQSVTEFLQHKNGSMYLGINGNSKKANWTTVYDNEDQNAAGVKSFKVSKVLAISTGTDKSNAVEILTDSSTTAPMDLTANKLYDAEGNEVVADNIYNIAGTTMSMNGYNRRYSVPDYVQLDTIALSDITADTDFEQYDMLVFEDSAKGVAIEGDLYTKFVGAMYSNMSIVYPSDFGGAAPVVDDLTNKGDIADKFNFTKLYELVATTNGEAKYSNIMITTRSKFSVVTAGKDKGTAKVIVDLINSSSYRGIGGSGSGSASSMFTVLEIQPCYPIDRTLAKEIGSVHSRQQTSGKLYETDENGNVTDIEDTSNYYIIPADVINGKAKEQVAVGSEYYAWELSPAKIADAFGIDVNQVNLLQMSSEELSGNKREIYGNVDLIYVGGNISALKTAQERAGLEYAVNQTGAAEYRNLGNDLDKLAKMPIYELYSHSGDVAQLLLWDGGALTSSNYLGTVKATDVGTGNGDLSSFVVMNGNDISYNNYLEMKKFVEKGLPVILSDKIDAAYKVYKQNNNLQNALDPQSNMVKFLNDCDGKANVYSGLKVNAVVDRDNDAGRLGDTLTGYVSVFARSTGDTSDSEEADANADPADETKRDGKTIVYGNIDEAVLVCKASKQRPKLTVTAMPPKYNMYDDSTKLTNRNLTFDYRVSGSKKFVASLYVDDNANSKFERDDERMASSTTNKLTYTVADSFSGPLYWMLEIMDSETGLSTYTTGISFIKSNENEKQLVRILQIMPGAINGSDNGYYEEKNYQVTTHKTAGEGQTGGKNTLYFCRDCQKASMRLEYNPMIGNSSEPRNKYHNMYDSNYMDPYDGTITIRDYSKGYLDESKIKLGSHMHRFGIVNYDSSLYYEYNNWKGYGRDDWATNLADEVSDLYDFDIDIWLREEFENNCNEVADAYDIKKQGYDTQKKIDDKIAAFNIDKDSEGYADFAALTKEEQVQYILQQEYQQMADTYYQIVEMMKSETMTSTRQDGITISRTLKQSKDKFMKDLEGILAANPNVTCWVYDNNGQKVAVPLRQEFEAVIKEGAYSELLFIPLANGGDVKSLTYAGTDPITGISFRGRRLSAAYTDYAEDMDKYIKMTNAYKHYSRLAARDNWIKKNYDAVVIGASEVFAGDDIKDSIALADLEDFIKSNGNMLVFHDTLTPFSDNGTSVFTSRMLKYFGNDRYHFTVDKNSNPQAEYVKYDSPDDNKYFMTNLSPKDVTDATRYKTWATDVNNIRGQSPAGRYLSRFSYSDYAIATGQSTSKYLTPYRYTEQQWNVAVSQDQQDAKFIPTSDTNYGTNRASQNNEGIVTFYPFTLGSELFVSPTHNQTYAVDVEDPDLTVWYSLSGGQNTKLNSSSQNNSSYYAADPRDAMDNYFIYSYGNVTYCGAGHAKVTGAAKDNNDERKLYINILCNSVRKSVKQPSIFVYDYGKETCGDLIKKSENGEYYTHVTSNTTYTDFNFKAITDETTTLQRIRIYYDLDYSEDNGSSAYVQDENHKLIADWTRKDKPAKVESGLNVPVFRFDGDLIPRYDADGHQIETTYNYGGQDYTTHHTMLQLQPEYFEKYDGYHTYIVIEATDSTGRKVYQRIKVMLKEELFDLT